MTTGWQHISDYCKAGFALFPVRMVAGKKLPWRKDWTNTPYAPDIDPRTLGAMAGAVLQSDDVVIDADPRRFPPGQNSLERLWKDLNLPTPFDTYMVTTGNGGTHVYFKKPSGVDVVHQLEKQYPGIEIKTKGQYVVIPGSQYVLDNKTHKYEVFRGSVQNIAEIPESLLTFITRVERPITQGGFELDDDVSVVNRVVEYLKTCPEAIEGQMGDDTTYSVACMVKELGMSELTAYELMMTYYNPRCKPPWEPEELRKKVNNAYLYAKSGTGGRSSVLVDFADIQSNVFSEGEQNDVSLKFTTKGKSNQLEPTLANALNLWLVNPEKNALYKLVRYNVFSDKIEFTRRAPWHTYDQKYWEDADDIMLKLHYSNAKHFECATQLCREVAVAASRQNQYHPIKDYVESIKWDGVERVETMFTRYAQVPDTEYHRAVARIMLVGAIKRIYEPGCKFDTMVVLESTQGRYKSTFIKMLSVPWYGEITMDTHKLHDTVAKMMGHWIIETPEMTFLNSGSADILKFFLSTSVDTVRFAFGRHTRSIPRQSIFVGTINTISGRGYLKDPTGNRRFLPVQIPEDFNLELVEEERNQLWAEAFVMYRNGVECFMDTPELERLALKQQLDRQERDPWIEVIENGIDNLDEEQKFVLSNENICKYILGLKKGNITRYEANRLAESMVMLGYRHTVKWDVNEKRTVRAWEKV